MNPIRVVSLFRKLGLQAPRRIHIFAGEWVEEGFEVADGNSDSVDETFG